MRFLPDDRGQSIQIGAVLLFAVLIILLALWQAFIVPNQNEEIEFNHNEDLQQQMTELRSTTNSMPDARTTQSVTLDLGVRYPSRSIFRNPPPARGTIRTVGGPDGQMTVTIANATALDREGETRDFWNGSRAAYDTKSIQYQPGYNEYSNAPQTIYEHSVLFNEFETEQQDLALSGQSLVRDDRLTLVTVNGSLSESRVDSTSLDLEPLSTETEVVEVEPDGGPITLELPTRLSEGEWRELFEGVRTVDPSDVTVDDSAFPDEDLGMLQVSLAQTDGNGNTQTYELRLAKIGLGTGTSDTDAEYVTDVAGDDSVIQRGQTQTLTVEVRDRFNKPLSGVAVNASAEGGEFADGSDNTTVTTGTDGEATLQYSGQVVGTNAVNVTIEEGYQPLPAEDHDATTPTNLTMDVTVERAPSGGNGGNSAYNVSWQSPTTDNDNSFLSDCTETGCKWDVGADSDNVLTLRAGTTPTIEGANLDFAIDNSTVGTVSPGENTTGSNGETTTDLTANENGTVGVYLASGSSSDVINITVENVSAQAANSPPAASFTFSPTRPDVDETITFDASGSSDPDGDTLTYEWDWDDDGTYEATGQTATHSYSTAGDKTVTLRVSDGNGGVDTSTETVTVGSMANSATISGETTAGSSNSELVFDVGNTGQSAIEVDGISVDNYRDDSGGNDDPNRIEDIDGGAEIRAEGTDLLDNVGFDIGSGEQQLTTTESISGGDSSQFTVDEFVRTQGGGPSPNDISDDNSQIDITLYFTDGSSKTVTLNP